jgi:hypothetical protein
LRISLQGARTAWFGFDFHKTPNPNLLNRTLKG